MSELIEAILSPVNLVLTTLLGLLLFYWLLVIFGALTMDSLDVDLDGHVDADLDFDGGDVGHIGGDGILDGHHGGAAGDSGLSGGAIMLNALRFFNVGEVPLMFLLSIFVLVLWVVGVASHTWVGEWSLLFQALMLVPFGIGAALITKVMTQPLVKVFRKLREEEMAERNLVLVGRRGRVVSGTLDERFGQVEVETSGAPLRFNARLTEPGEALKRGDEVVLVKQEPRTHVFLVRRF
ncbi:MAG: DUF1449 family protein [Phycisphaeraceae bacterium]|nr:DUF1449 family protein [Phycisphaeraceae bacterium]